MIKAIMYHYVRPIDCGFPYLRYLDVQKFEQQLDYFEKKFGFVEKDSFERFVNGEENECNGVILTFDDGLMDHYNYVLPILKRKGLWGVFYISTNSLSSKQMLDVHKIHAVLGRFGGVKVSNELLKILSKDMISADFISKYSDHVYVPQDNDEATKYVKQVLNYLVLDRFKSPLISQLMRVFLVVRRNLNW